MHDALLRETSKVTTTMNDDEHDNNNDVQQQQLVVSTAHEGPMSGDALQNLPFPTKLPYTIRRSIYNVKYRHHDPDTIIVLGIEGSANKVGVGIVEYSYTTQQYHILANPRKTFIAPIGCGFLPKDTSLHHQNHIVPLIRTALIEAFPLLNHDSNDNFDKDDSDPSKNIAAISYTKGPGMGGPLQSCAIAARTIATIWNVPMIGVNHCVGHIEMGRLCCNTTNPIVLYVSGGNTQVLAYTPQQQRYMIFGETIDIAIGNCLDRFARSIHLSNDPSPGYNIEQAAKSYSNAYKSIGQTPPLIIDLPYTVKGMDVSFSGILTTIEQIAKHQSKNSRKDADKNVSEDDSIIVVRDNLTTTKQAGWCYALQETIFAMLVEITERALSHVSDCSDVLIVGGVGCNERLQQMMQQMIDDRQWKQQVNGNNDKNSDTKGNESIRMDTYDERNGTNGKVCGMDHRYCIDNGAMIAFVGLLSLQYGHITNMKDTWCTQRYRTDQMPIVWRPNKRCKPTCRS
jgi:N6-L-threonylcarbamoyladenine synthase